ncbi:hypothetical protein [Kamptonema formosum]|uniref:hypothetical protein n=1 Tax=Kamptonema formosum TaxID=331992 RepID=UPI000347E778|nr:hypothetical protein [Oscillatoria sp. PCC 10802]
MRRRTGVPSAPKNRRSQTPTVKILQFLNSVNFAVKIEEAKEEAKYKCESDCNREHSIFVIPLTPNPSPTLG